MFDRELVLGFEGFGMVEIGRFIRVRDAYTLEI